MAPAVLISCQNISKTFGERPLLEGLSFALHERDRVGLIGPNGIGKSTLLKILAELEEPDEGVCTRRRGLRVGYVPQHPSFGSEETVGRVGSCQTPAEFLPSTDTLYLPGERPARWVRVSRGVSAP